MADIKVRNKGRISEKWSRRATQAVGDWQQGIQSPKRDWAQAAEAAAANWEAGVQKAVANQRFTSGVRKSGSAKWQRGAQSKGTARYPQGIAAARDEYERAMQAVVSTLEGITLPERGPRNSPQNHERARMVWDALARLREG